MMQPTQDFSWIARVESPLLIIMFCAVRRAHEPRMYPALRGLHEEADKEPVVHERRPLAVFQSHLSALFRLMPIRQPDGALPVLLPQHHKERIERDRHSVIEPHFDSVR